MMKTYFISLFLFLWRILAVQLDSPQAQNKEFTPLLLNAFDEWKAFLREGIYPKNFNRSYILMTDRVASHNIESQDVDYYITRALDSTIVVNHDFSFVAVYGKFLRFIFWGILKGSQEKELPELKIDLIKGEIKAPQNTIENNISCFLYNRILEYSQLGEASPKQQEKILKEIRENPEKFLGSDLGQSIMNDYYNSKKI